MLWPLRLIADVVVPLPDAASGDADARESHINSFVSFFVPACFEGVGVLYLHGSLYTWVCFYCT
jgi:hypothetical protein